MEDIILRIAVQVPGFLLAIVVHEAAHAWMAMKFGDPTAKNMGRLTLSPWPHVDILGTLIFPFLGAAFGAIMFGWARPVPIDIRYFKKIRKAVFWVSFAGPLSNVVLCVISAFLFAFMAAHVSQDFYLFVPLIQILKQSVYTNIVLAVFNLIPIPPLDGSKMVSSFLSYDSMRKYESLANYSFFFFLILMFTNFLSYVLAPAVLAAEGLITIFYRVLV